MQGSPVEAPTLLDVAGAVPDPVVQSLLTACKAQGFANIQKAAADCIADGWSVRNFSFKPSLSEACSGGVSRLGSKQHDAMDNRMAPNVVWLAKYCAVCLPHV